MYHAVNRYLETFKPFQIFLLCTLIIGILGAIDYITGYEISFSIFYLIPIAVASWYSRRHFAIIICIISAAVWMFVDVLAGHQYYGMLIPLWNALVRFGFFIITLSLLGALKNHMRQEENLSRTDSLTGINNSRAFKEWLNHYLSISSRFGHSVTLGYIDLDNFKRLNDTMGHSAGDQVLHAVAAILSSTVRSDDIVGRIGGDEFAVLLPNTDRRGATILFDKLLQRLLSEMNQHSWPIGFSVGVAVFKRLPKHADEALGIADRIMYQVKKNSKNSVQYDEIAEAARQGHSTGAPGRAVDG